MKVYGVGGQLLERNKAFYGEATAHLTVEGKLHESFVIGVGVRQGCAVSPWLIFLRLVL